MKTTIDSAGRLVIPKEVRRQAGLEPGVTVSVTWRNGTIEIEPAPLQVKLVRKKRLLVASPQSDAGELTAGAVEETRNQLRKRGTSRS